MDETILDFDLTQNNSIDPEDIIKNEDKSEIRFSCKNEANNHGLVESVSEDFRKDEKIMRFEICR